MIRKGWRGLTIRGHDNIAGRPSPAIALTEAKKAMLRILVISHYLWPEQFRINQVLGDLAAAGAEVTALTSQPNYPTGTVFPGYKSLSTRRERHPDGFDILRVPVVPRGNGGGVRLALNYLSSLLFGVLLGPWLLRGRRFDVVFVYGTTPAIQGYIATWLGWWKRAPVVQWVQDLWPHALSATGHLRSPTLLTLVDRVVRMMYRRSDLILGQSHAFVKFLRDQAHPVPVAFFPNPGEPSSDSDLSSPDGVVPGFRVVFAGNLGRAQALDTVVGAAALLRDIPDLTIHIYGSGVMISWIEREIKQLGLSNVIMPGQVSTDAIRTIYTEASALLLTLVDDPILGRTVPSKLQSYLAAGRPIVAAVSGEAAEIVVRSGSGIACRAGDPQALANAIRHIYHMTPLERSRLGDAGRRYFLAHYHPTLLAKRLLAGLSQVAAGAKADAFDTGDPD